MALIAQYATKKLLKASIGKPLRYVETSMFGPEYDDNGTFAVCNRPFSPELGRVGTREFFATVSMKDGLIHEVK